MSDFYVGARVVVINNAVDADNSEFYQDGARGTITEIDEDGDAWVKFDSNDTKHLPGYGDKWCVHIDGLAFVDEE